MGVVDEIKQRLDILDVIGKYVPLQRAGRNYKALCPFHVEKTPSFTVFPERQSWHCFGACGTGGDIFAFIMKKEGVDFREALRLLAAEAGVALQAQSQSGTGRASLLRAMAAAVEFYHRRLVGSEDGRLALEYLTSRGVSIEVIQAFQLGYSPASWDALRRHLQQEGLTDEELLAAGLVTKGERGIYDRFRHRIMFPVFDAEGRAVGFGARALDKDAQPKYLNTSQTAIYDKSRLLYAFDKAREAIARQDTAVIVEGYMDAIAAHQHGFTNVVACMGTSLTPAQVALLQSLTQNIVLALDADAAGLAAAQRGVQVAGGGNDWLSLMRYRDELSAHLRVVRLPSGSDPDDVIRADPDEWRRLVANAKPLPIDSLLTVNREQAPRRREPKQEPQLHMAGVEEYCLALLLRYRELRDVGLAIDDELFRDSSNRFLLNAWRGTADPGELAELLPGELHDHLSRLMSLNVPMFKPTDARSALAGCLATLRRRHLAVVKAATASELATIEENISPALAAELAMAAWRKEREAAETDGEPPEPGAADAAAAAEIAREAAVLYLRDMELGRRLHGPNAAPEA